MIDFHVHLAGTGCCSSGIFLSNGFRRRPTFLALRYLENVTSQSMKTDIDTVWAQRIYDLVEKSPHVSQCVALCLDEVYNEKGETQRDLTQLYVPNSWGTLIAKESSGKVLLGASVHPYRVDALEELKKVENTGAMLIKWLPSVQGIDLSHPRAKEFFRVLAILKLPLLSHTDTEHTFGCPVPSWMAYNDVTNLRYALDEGVTVIAAHAGTPTQSDLLIELMGKYPNLYADTSGFFNPSRARSAISLAKKARDSIMSERLIYASDWPVPVLPVMVADALGVQEYLRIRRIENPFERDIAIKKALGFSIENMAQNEKTMLTRLGRCTT